MSRTISPLAMALEAFRAARSRRGDKGRDDRRFLQALHHFAVHNIAWRALPAEFGPWNSVWKRCWRLSHTGVFEAFFQALAGLSQTAHLVQMFNSTALRAHVSVVDAKGGRTAGARPLRRCSASAPTSRRGR
jgi:transposase